MEPNAHSILIVDDDREICDLLSIYLTREGYQVASCHSASEAEKLMSNQNFNLIILDIMMPGSDGISFCKKLRLTSEIPILMLTALGAEDNRIEGLQSGADDYLCKPYNPKELLARSKAILRRSIAKPFSVSKIVKFGDWQLDIQRRELRKSDGTLVPLSSGEYSLLETLARNGNEPVNREILMVETRGREADPLDRTMDIQLSRLRHKLGDDAKAQRIIKTVRNKGYLLVTDHGDPT